MNIRDDNSISVFRSTNFCRREIDLLKKISARGNVWKKYCKIIDRLDDRGSDFDLEYREEIRNLIEKTIAFLHFRQMDEKTRAN